MRLTTGAASRSMAKRQDPHVFVTCNSSSFFPFLSFPFFSFQISEGTFHLFLFVPIPECVCVWGSMESVVTCCVCNGRMREPIKTLPCLHSACFQCLKSYSAKSLRDHHDQTASNCNAAAITCINGGGGGGRTEFSYSMVGT